jgi:hypothetical protein
MSGRWSLVLVFVAAVGLVALLRGGGDHDLQFTAPTGERSVVDVGEAGPSLGDMTVFSGPLMDGDEDAGRIDGVCTLTSDPGEADERRQRCAVTLTVGDGETELQLAAVGREQADDVRFSVVGGTGDYRDADGEALFDYASSDRVRIDLILED